MRNIVVKTFIVTVGIVPFFWLSWLSAAPDGERVVEWTPGERSAFIQSPLPAERVSEVLSDERGTFLTVMNEPVYFSVFPPSNEFTSAAIDLAFDPHDAFAVELGGLMNVAAYAFDFRPLSNSVLENIDWTSLGNTEDDGMLTVFAKDNVKASAQDFLAHQPPRSAIVTYRATLPGTYREPSYTPRGRSQEFTISLRGSHEYVTYIKNETFRLRVRYQDINRTYGPDEGYVRVYNEGGVVMLEERIQDDDDVYEDQVYTSRDITFEGKNWPEGVYRVELSGTSDIVWRSFTTDQRYLAFKNRLFIADDVGYLAQDRQTSFVTNSKSIVFETLHADSAHRVSFGSQEVLIPESHTKVYATIREDGPVLGTTDAGDVKMTGEGKFSPSKDSFFDPDPKPLTARTDLGDDSLRYVVASLAPVETDADGWRVAGSTFDLTTLATELGEYKFALSLPGLMTDQQTVDLHRITVTFRKPSIPLGVAIKNELRRWRDAVLDRLL